MTEPKPQYLPSNAESITRITFERKETDEKGYRSHKENRGRVIEWQR
jgi:hypothetical protein